MLYNLMYVVWLFAGVYILCSAVSCKNLLSIVEHINSFDYQKISKQNNYIMCVCFSFSCSCVSLTSLMGAREHHNLTWTALCCPPTCFISGRTRRRRKQTKRYVSRKRKEENLLLCNEMSAFCIGIKSKRKFALLRNTHIVVHRYSKQKT